MSPHFLKKKKSLLLSCEDFVKPICHHPCKTVWPLMCTGLGQSRMSYMATNLLKAKLCALKKKCSVALAAKVIYIHPGHSLTWISDG